MPKIQTQEKIIEVPEVLEKELDDVVNLIMMKVGSGGSRDVAGGTAGHSPKDFLRRFCRRLPIDVECCPR